MTQVLLRPSSFSERNWVLTPITSGTSLTTLLHEHETETKSQGRFA